MMSDYVYSPSVNAFFPLSLRNDYEMVGTWPKDGVNVSQDVVDEFMQSGPEGKKRVAGKKGLPTWEDIPPATEEEISAQNKLKQLQLKGVADSEITWRQDAVDDEIATEHEVTALTAWKKYRILLMRVDVNSPKWPKVPS